MKSTPMTDQELENRRLILKTQALVLMEIEKVVKRYDPFIAETVLLREKIEKLETENRELKQRLSALENSKKEK